ncbi:MAG: RepB family plasmid replication initiator protein [Bacteroidaceae bacterium]|nr:RepB family plasmid replication initiator protein [Bacteroidaceae bacterium]
MKEETERKPMQDTARKEPDAAKREQDAAKREQDAKKEKAAAQKTKKAQDESIIKNLPQNVEWIKQPYALSVMRGDLSLTQTHIMVELMGALQVKINDFIAHMGEEGNAVFKEEDFDENGVAHVDVSLAAVSNRPDYYSDVESMAYRLMSATIKKPEEVEGMKMMKLSHVFDSISVPFEDNERGRRKGFIRFYFNREQARDIFTFTRYSKYIKAVARNSSSQYTSRIYMIITAYKAFGRWEVEYSELRKILGFYAYEEGADGQWGWVEKKYTEYRQFKRRVLNTAADELRDLAEKGEADCYFDFQEIYPPGKKNGTPEKILFTITTSDLGKQQNHSASFAKKLISIEDVLKHEFDFRASEIRQILSRINDENMDVVVAKMAEVSKYMARDNGKILDKKKYAFTALRNVIDDFEEAAAEEIIEEMPMQAKESDYDGYAQKNRQENGEEVTDGASRTGAGSGNAGASNRSEWDGIPFTDAPFRDRLTSAFGARIYTMYFMQIRIVSFRGETVVLHIPHEEVSDYIDSNNLITVLKEVLSSIMGKVQTINYLVGV